MDFQEFMKKYGLDTLDEQQKAAVQTTEGPILLLAVPGSGKTTTLIARLGYLVIGKGITPGSILTMTYTVAATEEMRTRFAKKFGDEYAQSMNFKTINAVCANIIRTYAADGHSAFRLVSDEGKITKILSEIWLHTLQKYPTESDIKELRTKITYVKNQMIPSNKLNTVMLSTSDGNIEITTLYTAYVKFMRQNRLMDFDDQLVFAYSILKRVPGILNRYQDAYRYICVDEAQDTSMIQHKIIQMLVSKHRNLFMVGDEDQSIYGFRAAYPQALLNFEKNWDNAKVLYIETNYRSTPEIVDAAADFIHQNRKRRDKAMKAKNGSGHQISFIRVKDRVKQFDEIANISLKTKEPITFLYRNNDTALPIIDMLERNHIPYRVRGVDSLFFSNIIFKDICAFLKLAGNPSDADAFYQIYYKVDMYIRKEDAKAAVAIGGDILQNLKNRVERRTADRVEEVQYVLKQIPKMPPADALNAIVNMGYGKYLEKKGIDTFRLYIMKTLAIREKSIADFMNRLLYLQDIVKRGSQAQNAKILLSTIHSAKGLEYDNVILTDVADSVFPNADTPDALEEERRLFYVGMTRAKKKLSMFSFSDDESEFTSYVYEFVTNGPHLTASSLKPGQKIKHKYFGEGTIRKIKGQNVVVVFQNTPKTINLTFAIQNRIISYA